MRFFVQARLGLFVQISGRHKLLMKGAPTLAHLLKKLRWRFISLGLRPSGKPTFVKGFWDYRITSGLPGLTWSTNDAFGGEEESSA